MSRRTELGPLPGVVVASDADILNQRNEYMTRLLPFTRGVIEEDGYLQEALGNLNSQQRDILIETFADHVAANKFGRTSKERPYFIHRKDCSSQLIDPLMNRYSRRLRAAGVKNPGEYLGMLATVGEQISIATRMDPFFE